MRRVLARIFQHLTRTSRNQRGERGRCRMRRVEAANPSLTVGALNLAPEFSGLRGAKESALEPLYGRVAGDRLRFAGANS